MALPAGERYAARIRVDGGLEGTAQHSILPVMSPVVEDVGEGTTSLSWCPDLSGVESVPWHLDPDMTTPLEIGGHPFQERFAVPREAVLALAALATTPGGEPPWAWARALYEDGLIDLDFGLTPRGR